jgi:hypothetical protein
MDEARDVKPTLTEFRKREVGVMRRYALVGVVAAFVLGLAVAAAVPSNANAVNYFGGEVHTLTVLHSGKCLDREYTLRLRGVIFNPNDGAGVVQSACGGLGTAKICITPSGCAPTNQYWQVYLTGLIGPIMLGNAQSGKCVDVAGGSVQNYANVVQMPCAGTQSQLWDANIVRSVNGIPYYKLENLHSGLCLEVASSSTADGAAVVQGFCTGSDNQLWDLYNIPFSYHGK